MCSLLLSNVVVVAIAQRGVPISRIHHHHHHAYRLSVCLYSPPHGPCATTSPCAFFSFVSFRFEFQSLLRGAIFATGGVKTMDISGSGKPVAEWSRTRMFTVSVSQSPLFSDGWMDNEKKSSTRTRCFLSLSLSVSLRISAYLSSSIFLFHAAVLVTTVE